jgi:peptidoglycan LD-endopeptidase LytH
VARMHTRHSAPTRLVARLLAVAAVVVLGAGVVPASSGAEGTIAQELAKAYEEATGIAEELAMIETTLAVLETEVGRFDAEIADIRHEIAGLEDEVREIAVRRYVTAGNGPITFSADLLEHQRVDVMMSAVQRDSQATIAAYEDASRRLDASSRALADRLADQERARDRLARRLVDLDAELTRLSELQRQAEVEAARIAAERRQTAALAASSTTATTTTTVAPPVQAAAAPTTTGSTTTTSSTTTSTTTTTTTPGGVSDDGAGAGSSPPSSGFLCPVQGVSVFTDTWGAPRSGGRSHMGVDMLAKIGVPVVAPVSGTVTHRWNDTGGHSYHLDGDDGNFYYGTHMSAYGESGRVTAGTVIGYVGDSGNAAGIPHLHFEIHLGGRGNAVNPYPTVKAACG